jgi:3-phenylpropionate/trans-cinnamate dioxygenase alpha subunit
MSLSPEAWLLRMREEVPRGRVSVRIFNDPSVWSLEQERIFGRCWVVLGHESEIPGRGDYMLRYIADNAVIVVRDEAGSLRGHLNMCRHRGAQVCRAELGNASHFRCSYHGWTYDTRGELIGVPYHKEVYDERLDRSQWGLVPVRVDTYNGLIFGNLDPDAEPLADFLGGFQWYLDYYLNPTGAGTEVCGPPDKWIVDADWKICAENFAGDGYHLPVTHQFGVKFGYFPSNNRTHFEGYAVHIPGKGHGIGLGKTPGLQPFSGLPAAVQEGMQRGLLPDQVEVFKDVRSAIATIFPNLSLVSQPFSRTPGQPGTRCCGMRLWHPLGAGKIQVYCWCVVPKDAPAAYKEEAYGAFTLLLGPGGVFDQDDIDNWRSVTRSAGSSAARQLTFPYDMGQERVPDPSFPGPGIAVSPYVSEVNFVNLWGTWLDYMLADERAAVGDAR